MVQQRADEVAGPPPEPVDPSQTPPASARQLCDEVEAAVDDEYDVRVTGVGFHSCYLRSPDDRTRFVTRALRGGPDDLEALCDRWRARVQPDRHCRTTGVAGPESVGHATHLPQRGQVLEIFAWAGDPQDRRRLSTEFTAIEAVYG